MVYTITTMNRKGSKVVIAIYPNQLGFGFALMKNALTLLDYRVVVSRPMSNTYLLKRMKELIDFYEPEVVILENINHKHTRKSKRVQKLITMLLLYTQTKNMVIAQYTRTQIREVFANFKAKSKHQIASTIAQNIPALKGRLKDKRLIYKAESYAMGIFDSVSPRVTHYYLTD